jgi:putative membrane protein insertion efficiency factor
VLTPGRIAALPLAGLVWAYKLLIRPVIGPRCRYLPTCSDYALEALALHGGGRGLWLTLRRLLRCHPWGGSGYDPGPPIGAHRCPTHLSVSPPPADSLARR